MLFTTDLPEGRLELSEVIICPKHVLRSFNLISLSDEPLCVHLRTDLGPDQMVFQLENPNFTDNRTPDAFNELFNIINTVNEVMLQPRQKQRVIVSFSASGDSNAARVEDGPGSDSRPVASSFEIKGHLIFAVDGDVSRQIIAPIHAKMYRCVMKVDCEELMFDDCVPSATYVKDFNIWNLSEIGTSISLIHSDQTRGHKTLSFTVYDTGEPIVRQPIDAFSHLHIRVTFKPSELGRMDYIARVENHGNDESSLLKIHTVVAAAKRKDGLVVSTGGTLDFGDCYTGECMDKPLTLRNIGDVPLYVRLSTDPPDDVTFHTQSHMSAVARVTSPVMEDVPSSPVDGAPSSRKGDRTTELMLAPGKERTITVAYTPSTDMSLHEMKAARFAMRSFKILLDCRDAQTKEQEELYSKTVKATARVCTSIVRLSTNLVPFGNVVIGSAKNASVRIQNLSDMPASLHFRLNSTIMTVRPERMSIPPRQWQEIMLEINPFRANDDYRKEIKVENKFNRANDQIIEARANNMDRHGVTFHTLFYSLMTASHNNMIDFGTMVINSPSIRSFRLHNTTTKPLTLEWETSKPEIQIMCECDPLTGRRSTSVTERESILDRIDTPVPRATRPRHVRSTSDPQFFADLGPALAPAIPLQQSPSIPPAPAPSRLGAHGASAFTLNALLPPLAPRTPQTERALAVPPRAPMYTSTGGSSLSSFSFTVRAQSPTGSGRTSPERPFSRVPSVATTSLSPPMSRDMAPLSPPTMRQTGSRHGSPVTTRSSGSDHSLPVITDQPVPLEDRTSVPPGVMIGRGMGDLEGLTTLFEEVVHPHFFTDSRAEEMHVKAHLARIGALERALSDGRLRPVTSITLQPDGQCLVFVYFKPDPVARENVHGRTRKIEEKVHIKLIDYDQAVAVEHLGADFVNTPIRELPIRAQLVRSEFTVAQKNINFGKIYVGDSMEKKFVLDNKSDQPLLYRIRKSGNFDSQNIVIPEGAIGVARPWSRKEVGFHFAPRLTGKFHELITIQNCHDPTQSHEIVLKAEIDRAPVFTMVPQPDVDVLEFGPVAVNRLSVPQQIIVNNCSNKVKKFELLLADRDTLKCSLMLAQENTPLPLSEIPEGGSDDDSFEPRVYKRNTFQCTAEPNQSVKISCLLLAKETLHVNDDFEGKIFLRDGKGQTVHTLTFTAHICSASDIRLNSPLTSAVTEFSSAHGQSSPRNPLPPRSPQGPTPRMPSPRTSAPKYPLIVLLSSLIIDKCEVYDPVKFHFTVANTAHYPLQFSVAHRGAKKGLTTTVHAPSPVFLVKEQEGRSSPLSPVRTPTSDSKDDTVVVFNGVLDAGASKTIEVVAVPQVTGKQKHTLFIACKTCPCPEQSIAVFMDPEPPKFITFPDLRDNKLALGPVYVIKGQSSYAKVVPLRIQNNRAETVRLVPSSNITSQVYLFKDSGLTTPCDSLTMLPKALMSIYVALKPHITTEMEEKGECRPIVGGIKIVGTVEREGVGMLETIVKIAATVGCSILQVKPAHLDLGSVKSVGAIVKGSFSLRNPSSELPLNYEIQVPTDVTVSPVSGMLPGGRVPESACTINVEMSARDFGLRRDQILIMNKSSGEVTKLPVRLFVDDDSLDVIPANCETAAADITFDQIYVIPADAEMTSYKLAHPQQKITFTIRNNRDVPLLLKPTSNIVGLSIDCDAAVLQPIPIHEEKSQEKVQPLNLQSVSPMLDQQSLLLSPRSEMSAVSRHSEGDSVVSAATALSVTPEHQVVEEKWKMRPCGPHIRLLPQTTSIVTCTLSTCRTRKTSMLKRSQNVSWRGMLMFSCVPDSEEPAQLSLAGRVCKAVTVRGVYCVSSAVLRDEVVNLGQIGYVNAWETVPFSISLINITNTAYIFKIPQLPEYIHLDCTSGSIPPQGSQELRGSLMVVRMNGIDDGPWSHTIPIENVHNSSNTLVFKMEADLIHPTINIGLEENELILAPVPLPPVQDNVFSEKVFTLDNASPTALTLFIETMTEDKMRPLLDMDVVQKGSQKPATVFQIGAGESRSFVVRALGKADAYAPDQRLSVLLCTLNICCVVGQAATAALTAFAHTERSRENSRLDLTPNLDSGDTPRLSMDSFNMAAGNFSGIELAAVSVDTPTDVLQSPTDLQPATQQSIVIESVSVKADLLQTQTFSLSKSQIVLQVESGQKVAETVFELKNLMVSAPLDFTISTPPALDAVKLSTKPNYGTVWNSQQIRVIAELGEGEINSQLSLLVNDERASDLRQAVSVTVQREDSSQAVVNVSEPGVSGAHLVTPPIPRMPLVRLPTLLMKTLKEISAGEYEINVGQSAIGSGWRTWTFTLENPSSVPVNYRLSSVNDADEQWLQVSPKTGEIEPQDTATIEVRFSSERMGVFSTYILVENLNNPEDLKSIRCFMEVSVSNNSQPLNPVKPIFGVLVNAKDLENPVIKTGLVCYNHPYRNRSFEIVNHTDMPLEFVLACNLDPRSTELNFSLSYTSSKWVNSFTISPLSRRRVFIHFRPTAPADVSDGPTIRSYEISVTCRLVKDYRRVITLRAPCQQAQLLVTRTAVHFPSPLIGEESTPVMEEVYEDNSSALSDEPPKNDARLSGLVVSTETIQIRNPSKHPLLYSVVNDTLFFNIVTPKEMEIAPGGCHTFTLTPRVQTICQNRHLLYKGKYGEENFTIYNKRNPAEKWRVALKLSGPDLQDFFAAPLTRADHPFMMLEKRILALLRRFRTFWMGRCPDIAKMAAALREEDSTFSVTQEMLEATARQISAAATHADHLELLFEMHVATDGLIFFGIRGQGGMVPFQLASMLYSVLYKQDLFAVFLKASPLLWPSVLTKWVKQLTYFLSFFPGSYEVDMLRPLFATLKRHIKESKAKQQEQRQGAE